MRRRITSKIDEKSLKQEVKTEFTQNSQDDQQISLDINHHYQESNLNPSENCDSKSSSSQSSEYEEKRRKQSKGRGKRSMKKRKKEAIKNKKSLHKKQKEKTKSSSKFLSLDNSQLISKKYQSIFFSEQSLIEQKQKDPNKIKKQNILKQNRTSKSKKKSKQKEKSQKKVRYQQKLKIPTKESKKLENKNVNLKDFILKNGELHATDYELLVQKQAKYNQGNNQQNNEYHNNQTPKILYIFSPKYQINKISENYQPEKISLTSDQIVENHELFIELIRFYRNMWDDHVNIGGIFI